MMLLVNVCVCVASKYLNMKKKIYDRSMLGLCYKPDHDESVMY